MTADYRSNARFAGAMFLTATVASLVGGTLLQAALAEPGVLADRRGTVFAGVSLEAVNALAVLGIVAALWVPLRHGRPAMAIGYVGVRIVEATVCALAAFLPLALLASDVSGATVDAVTAIRGSLVGAAVPVVFAAGAVLLYLMLYRSALVPRYIPIWGMVGVAALLANLVVAQPGLQLLLVLPIITNEVYLGIYLLARGLRSQPAPLPY